MATQIKLRRDTAANWTSANPILALGEPGLETDTRKIKYGDGATAWTLLAYSAGDANFSGNYTDLSNKPTIPAAQIQSDWTQTDNTLKDFIKNKPVTTNGASAYEVAVANGFVGNLSAWLASLVGSPGSNGSPGNNGNDGNDGNDGASAYEVAVANGFVGNQTAWLASLDGADGADGNNGASAYEVAVTNGFVGNQTAWLASLDGADGADGTDGNNGSSAYEVAVANGFVGNETAWLASLVGNSGNDGASAYEVAVANGFVGNLSTWLASLVGADGTAGDNALWNFRGAYDSSLIYALGDVTTLNGNTYYSNQINAASYGPIVNPGGWTLIAAKGDAGSNGTDGTDGTDGSSAYEVAVANGFVGNETTWLASLDGADGSNGANGLGFTSRGAWTDSGTPGGVAYNINDVVTYLGSSYVCVFATTMGNDTGPYPINLGTYWNLIASKGDNGSDGTDGSNGSSAYQIAVTNGFVGDVATWLASLDGADGTDGADGSSAYEIALANGFVGNETAWIASLDGANGTDGADGTDGSDALWNFTGAYGSGTAYAIGDVATYGGETWYRINANGGTVGNTPTEGLFWTNIAQKGIDGTDGAQGVSVTLQGTKATIADLPLTGNAGDGWIVTTGDGATHLNGSLWFWNVTDSQWDDVGPIVGPQGVPGTPGTPGADGADGADGSSAYEVAVANGFVGNETAWLASLDGADGAPGTPGAPGADGADGSSAYEVAVANGFVGNQTVWLASLGGGIVLTDLSIGAPNSASGSGSLSYANTTGVFTYTPPVIPADVSDLTDTTGLLSGGSTLLEPYKGFRAHYGTMYNNTDEENGPINKLVIYKSTASPSSVIDTSTESDDFQVTGLTGSDVVAMLVVVTDGTDWDIQTPTATLKTFVEAIIDEVILDEGVEGDVNTVSAMRTAFYANFSNFSTIIPNPKVDLEFFGDVINPHYTFSNHIYNGTTGAGAQMSELYYNFANSAFELFGFGNQPAGDVTGYVVGDTFTILGTDTLDVATGLTLTSPANDTTITVDSIDNTGNPFAFTVTSGIPVPATPDPIWPNFIDDGGDDEYDDGNAIHTNLATGISYGGGTTQIESSEFNSAGTATYVVTYQAGIFGVFATGCNIDIIGTSGDDGGYGVDGSSSGFDGDGIAVTGSLYGGDESGVNVGNFVFTNSTLTANGNGGNLYIKAVEDLWLDALDDDVHIRANDDVRIKVGYNFAADTAQQEWRFDTAGYISFPDGSSQSTAYTGDYNDLSNKPTILVNDTKTVSLGTDGVLTLPEGGTIDNTPTIVTVTVDQLTITAFSGTQVLFTRVSDILYQVLPSGPTMELVVDTWRLRFQTGTWYESTDLINWGNVAGSSPAPVGTLGILETMILGVDSNEWILDNNGTLKLPSGGTISEGGGLTGAIRLTPAGGANEYQALMIYPTTAGDGDHIHLTAGGGTTELYLGSDSHFVKLANDGAVVIQANDGVSSNQQWLFGTDGNLTTPSSLVIGPRSGGGSLLQQNDAALDIIGEGSSAGVQLGWAANLSTPGNVALIAMNSIAGAGAGNIVIAVGNNATTVHSWLFGNNGNLTLPVGGNILDSTGTSVLGVNIFNQNLNTSNNVTFNSVITNNVLGTNGSLVTVAGGPGTSIPNSIVFDGSTSFMSVPASNDWAIGTTYTIEFRIYLNATSAPSAGPWIIMTQEASDLRIHLLISSGKFQWNTSSGNSQRITEPTAGQWVHVALVNTAGTQTIYYDGIEQISLNALDGTPGYADVVNATAPVVFGRYGSGDFQYLPAKLSGIRISKVARYPAAFTPPTEVFVSDSNTLLLMNVLAGAEYTDSSSYARTITHTATTIGTIPGIGLLPGNLVASAGSQSWTFSTDGNLTLPNSATIIAPSSNDLTVRVTGQYNICTVVNAGSGYAAGNSTSLVTGGSGTGMVVGYGYGQSGQIVSVSVTTAGTGYLEGEVLTMSAGDGTATFVITKYNSNANPNTNTAPADWIFDTTNNLTLPLGGDIKDSTGATKYIGVSTLKTLVAASTDFTDFQSRIAGM